MHLHTAGFVIKSGHMLKLREIKIGIEFAIDASQQVQVEGGGYSQFVVVRRQQLNAGFFEVGSEKKRVSGLKNAAHFCQKLNASRAIEVSDRASEEQHEKMLAGRAVRSHFEQSVKIFALEAHDADGFDVAKFAFTHGKSSRGNLD